MLSRTNGPFLIDLPNEWADSVLELLQDTYRNELVDASKVFEIYGQLYKGEVLVIASLVDATNEAAPATTYFASMDLADDADHTKLLEGLVDSIGAFFDQFFADSEWNDYQDMWKEEQFKGTKIYCKVTRENVGLSIKADRLLNQ